MKLKLKQIERLGFENIFKNIVGTTPNQGIFWNGTEWVLALPPNIHGLHDVLTVSNVSDKNHIQLSNNRIGLGNFTGSGENRNIVFGKNALNSNTDGNFTVAIGEETLYSNTHGNNHIAIGYLAGRAIINTSNNVYIGVKAGYLNIGGNNIVLGHNSLESTNATNVIIIGNGIKATDKNNYFALGIADDKILVEGDFYNKIFSIKGSVEFNNRIKEITRNVYTSGENEILVRNKSTGYYEVLQSSANKVLVTNSSNILTWKNISEMYELPIATSSVLGGVKIGNNINIDSDGVITAQNFFNSNGSLTGHRSLNGQGYRMSLFSVSCFAVSNLFGFSTSSTGFVINFSSNEYSSVRITTENITTLRNITFPDFSGQLVAVERLNSTLSSDVIIAPFTEEEIVTITSSTTITNNDIIIPNQDIDGLVFKGTVDSGAIKITAVNCSENAITITNGTSIYCKVLR